MTVNFKTLDELRVELVAHSVAVAPLHSIAMLNAPPEQREDNYYLADEIDLDMMPVSAARVSHGREDRTGEDPERDVKLMKFLAEHRHMTPFEHQSATFLVEAPLYVAREWMRHRTQSFNEISMRYTSDPADTFYMPSTFRKQADKNKQSSAGEVDNPEYAADLYQMALHKSFIMYDLMLRHGVARELARGVLGTAMITRFYATANLRNWAHWYKLRSDEGAQEEIRYYAGVIDKKLTDLWPTAWGVLKENT